MMTMTMETKTKTNTNTNVSTNIKSLYTDAIKYIEHYEFQKAKECAITMLYMDNLGALTQNLLGIIAELTMDFQLASKHYRAAYALDPTFKPAIANLDRVTNFSYKPVFREISF